VKARFWAREGQTHCYDCGSAFELAFLPTGEGRVFHFPTRCPNPECNRGSWVTSSPDAEFCIPVELDVDKVRRRIEDRLRKDPAYLVQVMEQVG